MKVCYGLAPKDLGKALGRQRNRRRPWTLDHIPPPIVDGVLMPPRPCAPVVRTGPVTAGTGRGTPAQGSSLPARWQTSPADNGMSTGVYLLKLTAGDRSSTHKMTILK